MRRMVFNAIASAVVFCAALTAPVPAQVMAQEGGACSWSCWPECISEAELETVCEAFGSGCQAFIECMGGFNHHCPSEMGEAWCMISPPDL